MENGKRKTKSLRAVFSILFFPFSVFFLRFRISAFLFLVFLSACQSSPTDLRTLAPGDALVYLESRNLRLTLSALTESEAWASAAKEKPDFSALENIQAAIVVGGFEASEKQITSESAVLQFKPRFALIADTHRWQSTNTSISENQIGRFARENYGENVKIEKSEKNGFPFYKWTSEDGRQFFAIAAGSVIYAGNDEALLDKCLAVKAGEAENLTKNENLARHREKQNGEKQLAFGYVSADGAAQLANLFGVSAAVEASEETGVRSFVSKILPEILRETTKEIVWSAQKTDTGIEDLIQVKTEPEIFNIFKETVISSKENQFGAAEFVPLQFAQLTRYNLQNPSLAWRGALLAATRKLDATSAKILLAAVNLSFEEAFAIADGDQFLNAVESEIVTIRFDDESEKQVVIAETKDAEKLKKAVVAEINFKATPEKQFDAEIWKSADGEMAAAILGKRVILGARESVLNCLQARAEGRNFSKTTWVPKFLKTSAPAMTITRDQETKEKIAEILGSPKDQKENSKSFYTTETFFSEAGVVRRTVSDFGLLGTLVEKIDEGN